MSKKIIFASILLFVVLAPFAHAETYTTSDSAKPLSNKEEVMRRQREAKAQSVERMENKKNLMSLSLEQKAAMREEYDAKREEFQKKLQDLRDQRKKLIVERVDKRLATINQNWAQRMNASILRLESLLKKFSDRSAKLKSEGNDTQAVDAAIVEAETAIQAAKDVIEMQEAKEYVADLTDEEKLRVTMGESMSNLRKDLKTAHDVVKAAKQKVIDVARALAKINPSTDLPKSSPTQTGTPSATIAPGI